MMNLLLMLAVMLTSSMMIAEAAWSADVTEDGKPHKDPTIWMEHELNTSSMISEIHDAIRDEMHHKINYSNGTKNSPPTYKHGGRMKRTIDALGVLSTSLNLIGILTSALNPIVGAIPLIIGTLIPLFFPGGDPVRSVWAEREESQRLKMIGFKGTMQHIARLNATDVEASNADLRILYYALNNDRLLFMRSDNIKSSAAYFKEFAKLHLAVNELLIYAYKGPGRRRSQPSQVKFWSGSLYQNLQEYIAYASYAVQQEYKDRTIRNDLEPSIANWTLLLNSTSQEELKNRRFVFYNQPVAFKVTPKRTGWFSSNNPEWLSCWNAHNGVDCHPSDCPCDDNPMKKGSGYDYYGDGNQWKCRGEIFWIRAMDPTTDGIVRSCDRVGIFYMHKWGSYWSREYDRQVRGNHWWLSLGEHVMPCPGAHGISDGCSSEVWRINGMGKPCNVPIIDRDHIELVNTNYERTLFFRYSSQSCFYDSCFHIYVPHFVIFKSDVSQGEYYRYLPSLTRPANRC